MKVDSSELIRLAREGSTREYVAALKETGSAVLRDALDTYLRKGDLEESQQALKEILDLKNSVLAHVQRDERETKRNREKVYELDRQIKSGEHPSIRLKGADNAELQLATSLVDGQSYRRLARECSQETTSVYVPYPKTPPGIRNFLLDLSEVQAAYVSASLAGPVPGLAAWLGELRERLEQARTYPVESGSIEANRQVHEWSRDNWFGVAIDLGKKSMSRDLVRENVRPEVLYLPNTSVSDAAGSNGFR